MKDIKTRLLRAMGEQDTPGARRALSENLSNDEMEFLVDVADKFEDKFDRNLADRVGPALLALREVAFFEALAEAQKGFLREALTWSNEDPLATGEGRRLWVLPGGEA